MQNLGLNTPNGWNAVFSVTQADSSPVAGTIYVVMCVEPQ